MGCKSSHDGEHLKEHKIIPKSTHKSPRTNPVSKVTKYVVGFAQTDIAKSARRLGIMKIVVMLCFLERRLCGCGGDLKQLAIVFYQQPLTAMVMGLSRLLSRCFWLGPRGLLFWLLTIQFIFSSYKK